MFEPLSSNRFPTPPPASARSAYDHRRPNVDGNPSATTFVATLIMLVLAIISALALIAASPVGIAVPMAMLLIGGLSGGIVAMRSRATSLAREDSVGRRSLLTSGATRSRRSILSRGRE